jgi:hypothetical protein
MNVGVAVIWYCCAMGKTCWVSIWMKVMLVCDLEREWNRGSIILQGPQVSEVKNAIAMVEDERRELKSASVVGN